MNAKFFIDTNIFIYQIEAIDKHKSTIADQIIRDGLKTGKACISFQVVQECLNTLSRKAEIPLDTDSTRDYFENVLSPLFEILPSTTLYQQCLSIQARYRYAFYDSLIIAAAIHAGCTQLYTEDLQHGQQIDRLGIENPFL